MSIASLSVLLRFLGLGGDDAAATAGPLADIERELSGLPPERARFFAAFAYVLARVADADLEIEDAELAEIERILVRVAGVDTSEATLIGRIASAHVEDVGATQNYIVTREFRDLSSRAERIQLIECLFGVAAADETITGDETTEVLAIAQEIGLTRQEGLAIRSRFRDQLAELRRLPGER